LYVCLCNALTDADIERAMSEGAEAAREIYAASGGRARCGSCVRHIQTRLREATASAD